MATSILKRILLFSPKPITPYSLPSFSTTSSSPSSDHHLISTAVSILTHHRSKSRWSHLRSLLSNSKQTLTPFQLSQIILHFKSNPHLALRFFHFTLKNPSLCSHDLHSLATLTHVLSRARLKCRAQSIIRHAFIYASSDPLEFFKVLVKSYRGCDSAPFVFDLLIKSCLESRKIDQGLDIARKLRSCGISLQVTTCNSLICSVLKHKGSCAGYGVFREVFGLTDNVDKRVSRVRPDVHSFNELMIGFYRDGDMEMVDEIWSEMERFGCSPNEFSYCVLMAVVVEVGKNNDAERLWEEMGVKGLKADVVAYDIIIGGFCKVGEIEKAEEFFREMELCGVESSCVTFQHLITGYCRVGNVDAAILVFKDMVRRGFRPESSIVDALIREVYEKRRVSEVWEIMRNDTFCMSGKSYELLIKGLCEIGNMDEALKLQAKMVGKGFGLNSEIYDAFIEGYMKLGNDEMAAMLRKELSEIQKQQEGS